MTHVRVPLVAALAVAAGLVFPFAAAAQVAVAVEADGAVRAPTAEERQALLDAMQESLSQSDKGLSEVRLDDGSVVVDLQGRFESVTLAHAENGAVITRCIASEAEARALLAPADAPIAHEER